MKSVFVSIVTYNSARYIEKCLNALSKQQGFELGNTLKVFLLDNGSSDDTVFLVKSLSLPWLTIEESKTNLGFAGGHNRVAQSFIESELDTFVILNQDLILAENALLMMIQGLSHDEKIGLVTPKLLRADKDLCPLDPKVIDAAGMTFTTCLRHFDRGSGEVDTGQYNKQELVVGGTGACLMMSRDFVNDMSLDVSEYDENLFRIYPQLREGVKTRVPLFDEAFFFSREDADLCWRAYLLGWRCLYVPTAIGYHVRTVTPEKRLQLPAELNSYSVRNRFLLQLNNFRLSKDVKALIPGLLLRNIMVIGGVFVLERASLKGLWEVILLARRALARRAVLNARGFKEVGYAFFS